MAAPDIKRAHLMAIFISRLSDFAGRVAAWTFVAVGAMITYEVAMRYIFNAPTIWAEEIARLLQLWATYLAAAYVLHNRELIRVTVIYERFGKGVQRFADTFGLVLILFFSGWAAWYGLQIALDSIEIGRASSTMLALPSWIPEFAIPVGFVLLMVQTVFELAALYAPTNRSA